ncbi:MAG: hypothetical protein K9W43_12035 [Candidatus Thorarchaeota archaeon]|nr:hypothetical protein [Candidatus Thorarchaeota archaeon]
MSGRLKVHEFMVIASGGVPIFHYSFTGERRLNELLSGFLSAITSFASEFGERSVQSLSFKGSEILYEQADKDTIFIMLVDAGAPIHILRAVLRDLSKKFLNNYSTELGGVLIVKELFDDFETEVHRAINYYEALLLVTGKLGPFVVPEINPDALDLFLQSTDLLNEFHRTFAGGRSVIDMINGQLTIRDIGEKLGLEVDQLLRIIEFLAIWGVVRVYRLCPLVRKDDARFDTFLDIIGLPEKDYRLLRRARMLCNGSRSIEDISRRLDVLPDRLYSVLVKLGDQVVWERLEISGVSRPRTL